MRYYETLYIINPNLADEDYTDVVAKFNGLIEKQGGVIIKVDEWGKKNLAYAIKKFDKGCYVLLQYCGEAHIIAELKREFKLDERVIKYQTIKLSDTADPEALKSALEETKEKVPEAVEGETPMESSIKEEDENGE
ncbi:MAG: 30S ribosomal protein S6 [Deltaproteobacteria bacterium]|nr:30S ribosomal protein S6 [Deltaproteobacteria bacterium]